MKHDTTPVAVHDVPSGHLQDNPWMGLAFYTEQNQSLFFGRQKESADLLRLLQRDTLTVLFGRSGMGKTSLLRAGLIPRLRQNTFFPVILRIDYADNALPPVEQVKALTIEAARISGIDVENISACGPDATLWEFFHTVEFWGVRNDILTPVLIFDQFEELFTLCRTCSGAEEFTTQLADLVENRVPRLVIDRISKSGERFAMDSAAPKYKVVLSLREDYVFRLDGLLPIMPAVMRNRLALHPLESERAFEVILGAGGHWVAEDVARCIVTAVAGKEQEAQEPATAAVEIEPAYLSVMCHELFLRMQILSIPSITQELVASEQGNILDGLYERSFEGLAARTRLFVEDHLLTPSGFRATLPIEDAGRKGVSAEELGSLVDRRLLRFEDRLGTRHVELAHDLLTPVVQRRRDERQEALARAEEQERQAALRQQLVRSRLHTAMALGLAIVLLSIGLYIWDYLFREHVNYYKSFTKRFGIPIGIGKLSPEAVKHREASIRFIQKGRRGPVLRMEAVTSERRLNAMSSLTLNYFKPINPIESLSISDNEATIEDYAKKACGWEFVYDSDGRVVYEISKDRIGRMVHGIVYAPQDASIKEGGSSVQSMYVGSDGYPQPQSRSHAEYVVITYNASGEESEVRFRDREGKPMPGQDRIFGYRSSYNSQGRLVRRTSFGIDGQPTADANGITTTTFQYDDQDNLVRTIYLDAEDRKTLHNTRGLAETVMDYDEWGNIKGVAYFDAYGKPAQEGKTTVHAVRFNWLKMNTPYLGEIVCFDTNDRPTRCINQEALAAKPWRVVADEDMNISKVVIYTIDTSLPSIEIHLKYDSWGFQQEKAYFTDQNRPITIVNGNVHRTVTVRDSHHLPIEVRSFDITNKSILTQKGFHIVRRAFDKQGRIIKESYFDRIYEPCENTSLGAHKVIKQYDNYGNIKIVEYYDTEGSRAMAKEGFHQKRIEYDANGNKVHERFYDCNLEPFAGGTNNIYNTTWHYDTRGNIIAEEYFGIHDKPVENAKGIYRIVMEYNKKNQETSRQYFGIDDTPAGDDYGVHIYRKVFNPQGQLIEQTCLGMSGEGMYDSELGIATYRTKFDADGRLIEWSHFDTSNHLALGPYGNAKTVDVYMENGQNEIINFGPDDKPMFNPLYGYVSLRWDPRTRGTVINTSYHSLDGILMFGPEGYAVQESTYDNKDRYIMRRWLGPDNELVTGPQGYHRIEIQHEPSGKTEKMFDVSGKEISSQEHARFPKIIQVSLEVTTDTPLGVKSPAAKAGMQTGDILWRYGDWSFPEAVAAEREKGTAEKNLLMEVFQAMTSERDKRSGGEVTVWVIRHGEPVRLTMPPLPEKLFGAGIQNRIVLPEVFDAWQKVAGQALLRNQ